MGRKTYEHITDRTALIDRYNVVLTSDLSYKKDGVVVVHSVEEALEKVASYKSEDIYVIGGESVIYFRRLVYYVYIWNSIYNL